MIPPRRRSRRLGGSRGRDKRLADGAGADAGVEVFGNGMLPWPVPEFWPDASERADERDKRVAHGAIGDLAAGVPPAPRAEQRASAVAAMLNVESVGGAKSCLAV